MCVVIGCLLVDLVMLIDTYRSMIVRFAPRAGFLSFLSRLFAAQKTLWHQGIPLQDNTEIVILTLRGDPSGAL